MQTAQLKTVSEVWNFIFAGNATFTLVSVKTGVRFTYKMSKGDRKPGDIKDIFFVSVLTGSDNESDYSYMGIVGSPVGTKRYIFDDKLVFKFTKNSKVTAEAPSAKAFVWFSTNLIDNNELKPSLEVWHEGRCGRCGRKLTVPESIAQGIGPDCAERMAA